MLTVIFICVHNELCHNDIIIIDKVGIGNLFNFYILKLNCYKI